MILRYHLIVLKYGIFFPVCAFGRWSECGIVGLVTFKVLESSLWNSCC